MDVERASRVYVVSRTYVVRFLLWPKLLYGESVEPVFVRLPARKNISFTRRPCYVRATFRYRIEVGNRYRHGSPVSHHIFAVPYRIEEYRCVISLPFSGYPNTRFRIGVETFVRHSVLHGVTPLVLFHAIVQDHVGGSTAVSSGTEK